MDVVDKHNKKFWIVDDWACGSKIIENNERNNKKGELFAKIRTFWKISYIKKESKRIMKGGKSLRMQKEFWIRVCQTNWNISKSMHSMIIFGVKLKEKIRG